MEILITDDKIDLPTLSPDNLIAEQDLLSSVEKQEYENPAYVNTVVLSDGSELKIRSLKILIAEDDNGCARIIAQAIKTIGKEIVRVTNGVEAVESCRNNPDFDLILMDIQMPQMDGYEATRQIRQLTNTVVIIAQTAYVTPNNYEKAIAAGCNDYIAKPIRRDKLLMLIEKYFKE